MPNEKKIDALSETVQAAVLEVMQSDDFYEAIKQAASNKIKKIIDDMFNYGDIYDAMKKKLTETMVPMIEKYNMSNYSVKLDAMFGELIENSKLPETKHMMSLLHTVYNESDLPEDMKIHLSDIFEKYKKFTASSFECEDREVVFEGGPEYAPFTVIMETESSDRMTFIKFESKTVTMMIDPDSEDDALQNDTLGVQFFLERYEDISCYTDRLGGVPLYRLRIPIRADITGLSGLNEFQMYLLKLDRAGVMVILDETYLDDEVHPDKEPEPTYR